MCIFVTSNIIVCILRYKLFQKRLLINDFFYFLDSLESKKPSLNIKMLSTNEINNDYIPIIDMYASSIIFMLPYIDLCNSYSDFKCIIQDLIENKHIVFNRTIINNSNLDIIIRHIVWKILLYKSNSSIYNFFIQKY